MNNFYRIKYNGHRLSSDTFNLEHERCLQFVKKAVSESIAKFKITLTHHVPTQTFIHVRIKCVCDTRMIGCVFLSIQIK